MTAFDKLTNSQKVRAALHRDTRAICSETCHFLGLEMTKPAMDVVAELVYKKLSVYSTDLEAFCKHAKRSTINAEDVKLLARRNPSLLTHLNATAPSNPAVTKRRKTGGKPQETPAKNTEESNKNKEESNKNKEELSKASDSKEVEKDILILEDKVEEEFAENMNIDDNMIDLTFD